VLLAPLSLTSPAAKEADITQLPVSDRRCAPWLNGLVASAAAAPPASRPALAVLRPIYGDYSKPKARSGAASITLIRGGEAIAVAPSAAAAATLIPGLVSAACQHTRIATRDLPSLPIQWNPAVISPLHVAQVGDQVQAESILRHGPTYLPPMWSETIRLRNVVVGINFQAWPGITNPLAVLQHLAKAASAKAEAVLLHN
jgi:hypothetical protein